MDKVWSGNSTQLLQEIDQKMGLIEAFLHQIFGNESKEEIYEMHHRIIAVSQLLLTLQQDPKMTSLAKELSLQLQSIQEQYNQLFSVREIHLEFTE